MSIARVPKNMDFSVTRVSRKGSENPRSRKRCSKKSNWRKPDVLSSKIDWTETLKEDGTPIASGKKWRLEGENIVRNKVDKFKVNRKPDVRTVYNCDHEWVTDDTDCCESCYRYMCDGDCIWDDYSNCYSDYDFDYDDFESDSDFDYDDTLRDLSRYPRWADYDFESDSDYEIFN